MRLTAVIATRDAGRWLPRAIESTLRELPASAELVVVDDASRDDTPRILAGFADRVRVLRNESPLGPGEARNRGVAAGSGEFVAFHDADDEVLPGRFTALLDALDADPGLDLVFANGENVDDTGRRLGPTIPRRDVRRLLRAAGPAEMVVGGFVYPQALCMRRASFERLGGFRALPWAEDWEFALRASMSQRLRFVDRCVFRYRRHPDSITMRKHAFAEALLETLETFVAEHPELARLVPGRELRRARARRWARVARHRLAAGRLDEAIEALDRAIALDPARLGYRWRRLLAPRAHRAAIAG